MSERLRIVPKEHPPVHKRKTLPGPIRYAGTLVVAGLVGYGAGQAYWDAKDYFYGDRSTLVSPPDVRPGIEYVESLELYFAQQRALMEESRFGLERSVLPTREIIARRDNMIMNGLELLGKVDGRLNMDLENRLVNWDGVDLSLDNEYHKLLIDAITYHSLRSVNPLSARSTRAYDMGIRENLIWMGKQNLPVNVESGRFIFLKEGQMALLSSYYRIISELGHPMPKEISFRGYREGDSGVGWYKGDSRYVVTTIADVSAVVHEDGHLQAFENGKFSQAQFNNVVRKAIEESVNIQGDLSKSYVSLYVANLENAERTATEDYAETHSFYFVQGDRFRALIRKLRVDNPRAAYVLEAKYQDRKNFYGGEEFNIYGEVFEPKIGEIFYLDDPDYNKPGIFLRTEPTFAKDTHVAVAFDGSLVKIKEGPVEVIDSFGVKRRMYRVAEVDPFIDVTNGRQRVYLDISESGWMSDEWFDFRLN